MLLLQLRNFRKEASQPLATKASKQVLRDEGVSQDPESLEEMGTLKIRRKRCLRARGEANKVTSRWLVRSDSQRGSPPSPNQEKQESDPSRENQKETEETLRSESAPEPPLNKAAESPRYNRVWSKVISSDSECCSTMHPSRTVVFDLWSVDLWGSTDYV